MFYMQTKMDQLILHRENVELGRVSVLYVGIYRDELVLR